MIDSVNGNQLTFDFYPCSNNHFSKTSYVGPCSNNHYSKQRKSGDSCFQKQPSVHNNALLSTSSIHNTKYI